MEKNKSVKKPKVSVIVSVLNDEKHVGRCIDSIFKSSFKNLEIIVIDDGSTDNTVNEIKKHPCRLIELNRKGISYSRNFGAKKSTSDILYFVDSDIVQHRDTIRRMVNFLMKNKKSRVVCAFIHKKNLEKGFIPEFLSLQFSYNLLPFKKTANWINSVNSGAFMTYKNTFFEVGGFNEKYNRPGGEEFDFSYRVFKKHLAYYSSDIFVYHHFKHFFPVIRNMFWRTSEWIKLFFKERKFETVGSATSGEALNTIIVFLTSLFFIFGLFNTNFFSGSAILFGFFIARIFPTLAYMAREKNILFSFKGFFFDYFLYLIKSLGFIYGISKIIRI